MSSARSSWVMVVGRATPAGDRVTGRRRADLLAEGLNQRPGRNPAQQEDQTG